MNKIPIVVFILQQIAGIVCAMAGQPDFTAWEKGDFSGRFKANAQLAAPFTRAEFFHLDQAANPAVTRSKAQWFEYWAEPGVDAQLRLPQGKIFASLGFAAGGTLGEDLFGIHNGADSTLTEAFAGYKTSEDADSLNFSAQAGRFRYCEDTGMLINGGRLGGGHRGLAASRKWQSWDHGAIAGLSLQKFSVRGYYLAHDGIGPAGSDIFAGTRFGYDAKRVSLGAGYMRALDSKFSYPTVSSPLVYAGKGRDKLNAAAFDAKVSNLTAGQTEIYLRTDVAYEWKDNVLPGVKMKAWGTLNRLGADFNGAPLKPHLYMDFGHFSGDRPDTFKKYERFDPVWWSGGYDYNEDGYWFGAAGSSLLGPSNLNVLRFSAEAKLTEADGLKLQYIMQRADKKNSPLTLGESAGFDYSSGIGAILAGGVSKRALLEEFTVNYSHSFQRRLIFALSASFARPGTGLRSVGAHGVWWSFLPGITVVF